MYVATHMHLRSVIGRSWWHMRHIDTQELKRMMDEGADFTLIDARSHDAYDREHLPGAVSMPSDHMGEHVLKDYDNDETMVTYCTDLECTASTIAARKLDRYGFKKVLEYKAGIEDWKKAGYPVITKGH